MWVMFCNKKWFKIRKTIMGKTRKQANKFNRKKIIFLYMFILLSLLEWAQVTSIMKRTSEGSGFICTMQFIFCCLVGKDWTM